MKKKAASAGKRRNKRKPHVRTKRKAGGARKLAGKKTGKGTMSRRKSAVRKRRRKSFDAVSYDEGFNQTYNEGYNAGFAKGFEDGHQIAYETQV